MKDNSNYIRLRKKDNGMDKKIEFHFYQLISDEERQRIAEEVVQFVYEYFDTMPRMERRKGKSFYLEIEPYFLRIRCKISSPIEVIEMKENEFFNEVSRGVGTRRL